MDTAYILEYTTAMPNSNPPESIPATPTLPIGETVIVRARDAGVHYGIFIGIVDGWIVLERERRIWYWDGAASLSELAVYGTARPGTCRFGCRLPTHWIRESDSRELIACQPAAIASIDAVPEWRVGA